MRRRVAWFHCFSGIAGDMALGALVDAGAGFDAVTGAVDALGIAGITLRRTEARRGALRATRIEVSANDDGEHRSVRDLGRLIEKADIPERVVARALAVVTALGRAEAKIHGIPVEEVHLHEAGGHDAIADIVGTCAALESLDIGEVYASPVALGSGSVETTHGMLPVPAPATLELLAGAPVLGTRIPGELTTPTGAAILAALATDFGPAPPMTVESVGYGAGAADRAELPNCTRVVVGTSPGATAAAGPDDASALEILETNVDDVSGELLAHCLERLLTAGARDAWVTPVTGKKGRPAHIVSVLCDAELSNVLMSILLGETGSLGARRLSVSRTVLERTAGTVELDGWTVRVKEGPGRVKAESDDVAAISRATGRSFTDIARQAEDEWRRLREI